MSHRSHSLAQKRRDDVVAHLKQRGRKVGNIWILYSPLDGRDVILIGDLKMEHFFACEGDPQVREADYNPAPIEFRCGDRQDDVHFDALVTLLDGTRECRFVVDDSNDRPGEASRALGHLAASSIGAVYREVREADLTALRQRVVNWYRLIGIVQRCQRAETELIEALILARLANERSLTVGSLLEALCDQDAPVALAALVRLVRRRRVLSDIDERPWSVHTTVRLEKRP